MMCVLLVGPASSFGSLQFFSAGGIKQRAIGAARFAPLKSGCMRRLSVSVSLRLGLDPAYK